MDSDTCSEILARFPGPVTLYPSRRKWLLLMAGCLLFAVGNIDEVIEKAAPFAGTRVVCQDSP